MNLSIYYAVLITFDISDMKEKQYISNISMQNQLSGASIIRLIYRPLKPQGIVTGEFDKIVLDLAESAGNHQKRPSDLSCNYCLE